MDKSLNALTEQKIEEIEIVLIDLLKNKQFRFPSVGLAGGAAGFALFFFYRHKQTQKDYYLDIGFQLLQQIIDSPLQSHMPSYCGGLAGVGWLIEHLVEEGYLESDTNETLQEFDSLFLSAMDSSLSKGCYDFLHGGVGYGYYFLSRHSHPERNTILHDLTEKLATMAIVTEKDVRWPDYDLKTETLNYNKFNLGLSHGIPSITAFLSKVYAKGINQEVAKYLINGSTEFLLNAKFKNPTASLYPYSITEGQESHLSRLAWCYGDLGIALTFWITSKHLGSEKLKKEALYIMDFALSRKDLTTNNIVDGGLCHGTAGIAQIFYRFYWETGDLKYKEAADYWIDQTLKMATFSDGLAGFKALDINLGWRKDYGLLEGISGIGIAMISSLSPKPLRWDEWLLMS